MAQDERTIEERITELQNVVTKLFTYTDSMRATREKGVEKFDDGEVPDFGPWMDTICCFACVIAIRTNTNGDFQFATLELLEDCNGYAETDPKWKKGVIFDLRNRNWEAELKRAQNHCLVICLRVSTRNQIIGLELGAKDKVCCPGLSSSPKRARHPKGDTV